MAGNKKDLRVQRKSGTINFEIKFNGGGEVPQELCGEYTNENIAKSAIATYLEKRDSKRASTTDK